MFNLDNFTPPQFESEKYRFRKLTANDAELDLLAVLSSIDIIHQTRGGDWPSEDLSLEDDRIDLSWHQREFEWGYSFAFTIMNPDETKCLGCIYFYPPGKGLKKMSELGDSEVEVSWWITQEMYNKGEYRNVSNDIRNWVETEWPFKKIHWANKELPES